MFSLSLHWGLCSSALGRSGVKALGQHDVGNVQGAFALDDRALGTVLIGVFLQVLLDHVRPFDDDAVLVAQDLKNLAALAALGARDNHYLISFFDVKLLHNSNYFRRQRNYFHELLLPQLAGDGAENTGAARVILIVNDDDGIGVEPQIRAVVAPNRVPGPHHHCVDHFTLFDRTIRRGFLDVRLNDVADVGVALVAAQHADGGRPFGAGIIGHFQNGTDL